MADQQFLASFGVDIDESGVSRLQKILVENRTLADSLPADATTPGRVPEHRRVPLPTGSGGDVEAARS